MEPFPTVDWTNFGGHLVILDQPSPTAEVNHVELVFLCIKRTHLYTLGKIGVNPEGCLKLLLVASSVDIYLSKRFLRMGSPQHHFHHLRAFSVLVLAKFPQFQSYDRKLFP